MTSPPEASLFGIGHVARQAGCTVATVRYYDNLGLVPAVERIGGKRYYVAAAIDRLDLVRRLKTAGFTLDQIHVILDDRHGSWRQVVDDKLCELRARRDHLDRMIDDLTAIETCRCDHIETCPRIAC